MNWSTRRKILYALATIFTLSSLFVFIFRDTIFPSPTCSDKKKNGFELEVDCGGTCSLRCQSEVSPLTTVWARAIKTPKGTYDLVAMVSNKNTDNASKGLSYMFTVYDAMGAVLATTTGRTATPIEGDFPVILQDVAISGEPSTTSLTFEDGPHYKVPSNPASPILRVSNIRYEDGETPRVYAVLENTKRVEVRNLPVYLILYDENNNAYAVGTTHVDSLGEEDSQELVFLWKAPLTSAPIKIRIYPILNPFLGVQ